MLDQLRYQQQFRQLQSEVKAGVGTVATYGTRDTETGQRVIRTADGGVQVAQYISNSEPDDVLALSQSRTIGLVGYASQKPH
jgi:tRNA G18 (ribose-2'-O)-methylase SpoU